MPVGTPVERAKTMIEFAGGLDAAGFPDLASRVRVIANDVLELSTRLAQEHTGRVAIQGQRDHLQKILGKGAYAACVAAAAAEADV